ncbi:MAG: hypothetical protein QM811_27260 [Pirellulales bacterium]
MPVADFFTASAMLSQGMKTLIQRWQNTKESWNDPSARQFEADHLEPLPHKFRILLDTTSRLSDLLQRAEQDCSEHHDY